MKGRDGKSGQLMDRAEKLGIHVIPLEVRGRIDLHAVGQIRKILKQYGVSIVHSHDYKSDIYALLAAMNLGIIRVITAHGSTRDSLIKRLYLSVTENVIYRFSDKIVAVSVDISQQLRGSGIRSESIEVIQNGLDSSLIEDESKNQNYEALTSILNGRTAFGVIGRLFPDKGHRFFVEAFANVLKTYPSIVALVLGEGPAKQEIMEDVGRRKLENHIHFCGARSDMKNVYDSIDFLVIPSLREGLPYVLLEAMVSEIPVLATAVGDIPALVRHEETGYLVDPGDAAALERHMVALLRDPAKARDMAKKGHRLVTREFSATRMVHHTEGLYRSLLVVRKERTILSEGKAGCESRLDGISGHRDGKVVGRLR
jgi:glycosyltransferase involved in cell wall biosynthesis